MQLRVLSNFGPGIDRMLGPSTLMTSSAADRALLHSLEFAYDGAVRHVFGRDLVRAPKLLQRLTVDGKSHPYVQLEPDCRVRMVHLEVKAAFRGRLEQAVSFVTGIPLPPELLNPDSDRDESGAFLPTEVNALDGAKLALERFWAESGMEYDYAFLRWYARQRGAAVVNFRKRQRQRQSLRAEYLQRATSKWQKLTGLKLRPSAGSLLELYSEDQIVQLIEKTCRAISLRKSKHDAVRLWLNNSNELCLLFL